MNSSTKLSALIFSTLAILLTGCGKPADQASQTPKPAEPAPQAKVTLNGADWPKDVVWYQIFPERFRNGDKANDPTRDALEWPVAPSSWWRVSSWTDDWYKRSTWELEIGPDFFRDGVLDRRFGGDLQGVLDKLDYIADLGVNAIYFNPLFYSRSLHKYDGNTYHHIDPYFGPDPKGDLAIMEKEIGGDPTTWQWTAADKMFLKVLAEAHKRGMRVILDGVFNHTGRDFFAFRDLMKNQDQSRYRDWYVVESFDDPNTLRNEFDYKGWWGHKTLPVFASTPDKSDMAQGPKDYIFAATKRWMDPDGNGDVSDGIDGWRLDVADERPAKFWDDWNTYVRKLNPKAYTSSEVWSDPSHLIADGKFSACMNYFAFSMPVKGFLIDAKINATQFLQILDNRRNALPPGVAEVMQNLMGSHDTDRLASMIVNRDLANYSDPERIEFNTNDKIQESKTYKIRKPNAQDRAIQRLVVLFQMTYPGAPMIYYGDEAGMWGATDPDDRLPMVWADMKYSPQAIDPRGTPREPDPIEVDTALLKFYKSAIALRQSHDALRHGEFRPAGAFDAAQAIAFQRRSGSENLLVVMNRSEQEQTVAAELPEEDAAKFAKAHVIFSTNDGASVVPPNPGDRTLSVKLPPLTGAVIAP